MSSHDTRRLLADAVDRERRRHTLTAAEVARRAGVDPETVRRLLAGGQVRFSSVRLIVTALGVEWHEFLMGLADATPPETVAA